jgi:hypothetical protein
MQLKGRPLEQFIRTSREASQLAGLYLRDARLRFALSRR